MDTYTPWLVLLALWFIARFPNEAFLLAVVGFVLYIYITT